MCVAFKFNLEKVTSNKPFMIRVLLKLDRAIRYYGILHLNQEECAKADEELLSLLSDLELENNPLYLSNSRPDITPYSFYLFYSQFRRRKLYNQLFK